MILSTNSHISLIIKLTIALNLEVEKTADELQNEVDEYLSRGYKMKILSYTED